MTYIATCERLKWRGSTRTTSDAFSVFVAFTSWAVTPGIGSRNTVMKVGVGMIVPVLTPLGA